MNIACLEYEQLSTELKEKFYRLILEINLIEAILISSSSEETLLSFESLNFYPFRFDVMPSLDESAAVIQQRWAMIKTFAKPAKQQEMIENIVSFSVEGKTISIRKSLISQFIPDSQLAIRLSPAWTEQASTLDEQGRIIIVSCIFLLLLSSHKLGVLIGLSLGCVFTID
jgi:hypothetical protein